MTIKTTEKTQAIHTGTTRLLAHTRTVLYCLLGKHNETRQFFHIPRFLHFINNRNESVKPNKNYDIVENENYFHKLCDAYAKYYSPTEHCAVAINVLSFSNHIHQ
jgi:N6-adenosine-specific RNA methylase IME4